MVECRNIKVSAHGNISPCTHHIDQSILNLVSATSVVMHRKLAIQGSTQAYACRHRLFKCVSWHKVAKSLLMPLFLFSNTAVADVDVNESLFGLQQLRLFANSPDGYVPISQPAALAELMGEEQVDSLTLEDARRKAHESSYSLGASRSKTSAAANLARAAYSGVLPSVNLRTARGRENSTPSSRLDDTTGEALAESTQIRKEVYAVISQPLLDLSAVSEIRRTAAVRKASEFDESGVRGDVTYDSSAAFFSAVEAELSLKLALAQQQRLERLGIWMSARAEAGGASGADRERINARVLSAKSNVEDAISQANQAYITLSQLTGTLPRQLVLPSLGSYEPVGSLEDALAMVSHANPAVLTARANEEASKQERLGYWARFTPTLKFELSTTNIDNAGGVMGWRKDERAMLVLNMSLFAGGGDYFKQRASHNKEEQYAFERLDSERTARRSLQIAYSGLSSARQKIKSLTKQAQAQAKVVEAFDAQLAITSRNLLDVFDAYQQYYQSQLELVRTSVQAILLEQQILRVTGRLGNTLPMNGEG